MTIRAAIEAIRWKNCQVQMDKGKLIQKRLCSTITCRRELTKVLRYCSGSPVQWTELPRAL